MKIKNFLLGVSLAVCGAAFGQVEGANYHVYVPDLNKSYFVEDMEQGVDDDGNTTIGLINVISEVEGDAGEETFDFFVPGKVTGGLNSPYGPTCGIYSGVCVWILDYTQ